MSWLAFCCLEILNRTLHNYVLESPDKADSVCLKLRIPLLIIRTTKLLDLLLPITSNYLKHSNLLVLALIMTSYSE